MPCNSCRVHLHAVLCSLEPGAHECIGASCGTLCTVPCATLSLPVADVPRGAALSPFASKHAMQFVATASDQQSVILLDTGVEACFLDVGSAKQHGLVPRAMLHVGVEPTGRTVNLADGTPTPVYGSVSITLAFPRAEPNDTSTVSVRAKCHLVDLGGQWQCILGDDFMHSHRAFLQDESEGARVLLYQPNTRRDVGSAKTS